MKLPSLEVSAGIALVVWFGAGRTAWADTTLTDSFTANPEVSIPDGSEVGVADTVSWATPIDSIHGVTVSLSVSGDYNGDLYAYLQHGSEIAILLNRPGVTATAPYGYADGGLQVTLDDTAVNGDIHNYRLTLNPAGGALTGIWQPDGRNVLPASVLDTTPRTAGLSVFNGQNANGTWTLFMADVSPGGTSKLNSWTLTAFQVIPEPSTPAMMAVGAPMLLLCLRRNQRPPKAS